MLNRNKVLCVDLDGTFIKTDMLYESFVYHFIRNPLVILYCMYWLSTGGITKLKFYLSKSFNFNPSFLPINYSVLELINAKKSQGYSIYLISASTERIVQKIYIAFSDLFDVFFSSKAYSKNDAKSNNRNLKGKNKADFIKKHFPNSIVEYVGNSRSDIDIWRICDTGYLVTKSTLFSSVTNLKYLDCKCSKNLFSLIFKQIRIHQWVKNILIFVPLITCHTLLSFPLYCSSVLSFFSFCFVASSVYCINDLVDIDNDRCHETKKYRPLASGELPIISGLFIFLISFLIGCSIALIVSFECFTLIVCYFLVNLLYSFKFKQCIVFDCILLSLMYTYRIFIGCIVSNLDISVWLLSFSFFIFLSLAFIKRYDELLHLHNRKLVKGRNYLIQDKLVLLMLSISSGILSILIFDIYLNTEQVRSSFNLIWLAYFCIPILFNWLAVIYIQATRGSLHNDPIVFAIKNKTSLFLVSIFIVLYLSAALI